MIVTVNHSTVHIEATVLEALELVKQLTMTIASAVRRKAVASFCEGISFIDKPHSTQQTPGVMNVVID